MGSEFLALPHKRTATLGCHNCVQLEDTEAQGLQHILHTGEDVTGIPHRGSPGMDTAELQRWEVLEPECSRPPQILMLKPNP